MPTLVAKMLPLLPLVAALHTQTLSGYSRVVNQNTIDTNALLPRAAPQDPDVALRGEGGVSSEEQEGGLLPTPPLAALLAKPESRVQKLGKSMSTKESLALFMRENLQAGQSAMAMFRADQSAQPTWDASQSEAAAAQIASQSARRKQDELSSLMKKRLAAFVRKFMKAEIHGVRVERRQNGISN